jgi:NhaA family Na+:H+ antiporter
MLKSGVHPTIAGVMLAFAIPFTSQLKEQASPSYKLEKILHKPAAFLILPLFALANTAIIFEGNLSDYINTANFVGISLGLLIGKPLGVMLFSFIGITLGFSKLPAGVNWGHLLGAGILGGIGFTMSIFITNLAFQDLQTTINASKIAIMFSSLIAGLLGFIWLKYRAS